MSYVQPGTDFWQALENIVSDEGLVLYDIMKLSPKMLRVFVERSGSVNGDHSRGQGGVTSEDCSRICRRLMVIFSAEGEKYGLDREPEIEVSSPGINRHLRLEKHFSGAVGERIKISFATAGEDLEARGMRSFIGNIVDVSGDNLRVQEVGSGKEFIVGLRDVTKARVDFQF